MGPTAFVPVEEYLASSYDPDVDFVDGEIEERNAGETMRNCSSRWSGFWTRVVGL
jgi:hypothetical protein